MRRNGKRLVLVLLLGVLAGLLLLIAHARTAPEGAWLASLTGLLLLKGLLAGVSLAAWFWTQSLIAARNLHDGRINDALHHFTASWNAWLHAHRRTANSLLIASSAGIDMLGLFLIGAGLFGPTLRPFLALLILFAFRQLSQALCALPTPPNMLWRHPGFPSLLVTYGTANDFFFSGHTAIAVLGAITATQCLPIGFGMAAILVAILEGTVVIVLRAHYTMDVLCAVAAAFCASSLAGQLCAFGGL